MESLRAGLHHLQSVIYTVPLFCTMVGFMYICGLRRRNGLPKWPSLVELCGTVLDETFDRTGYHSAEEDASMTAKCFFAVCGGLK
jgi:hypothetical protein